MAVRLVAALVMLTSIVTDTALRAEEGQEQRTFGQCFLYRGADGDIWVGHPLVSLGMIGVMGNPPLYRLNATLAERFAPLVNELRKPPAEPEFWWWGLPTLAEQEEPLILIRIRAKANLQVPEKRPAPQEGPGVIVSGHSAVYEIVSADLIYAEFLSPAWRRAWKSLDEALAEIVSVSRTAPGNEKSQRLAEAIERASRELNAMTEDAVDQRYRDVVRQIEPRARAVRLFQSRVQRVGIGQWGAQLRDYAARLRIEPTTPLPKPARACPLVQRLADSSTAAELLATVRASWPGETLDQRLIFSEELGDMVFLWQVQYLTEAEFQGLQKLAREELAGSGEQQPNDRPSPVAPTEEVTVAPWNVVLRTADADRLVKLGLLSGTVVHRVLSDGSPIGLKQDDVIIDYDHVYDLVMSAHPHYQPANRLSHKAKYEGSLDVLRGNCLITLAYSASPRE